MLQPIIKVMTEKALDKKLCPACTRRLDKQKNREPLSTEAEIVTCDCGKVYLYDRLHRQYSIYQEQRQPRYPR